MACLARYLCTPKLETLVDPLSTFIVFFLLFPSALTPNNFRTEGSVKKKVFFPLFLSSAFLFPAVRFKFGMAGCKARTLPLCYAVPRATMGGEDRGGLPDLD